MVYYHYLFYKMHKFALFMRTSNSPWYSALLFLTLIEYLNVLSLILIFGFNFFESPYYGFALLIIIYFINYALLYFDKKYLRFNDICERVESKTSKIVNLIVTGYVILSFMSILLIIKIKCL